MALKSQPVLGRLRTIPPSGPSIAVLSEDSILKMPNVNIPRSKAISILTVRALFSRITRRNMLAEKLSEFTKKHLLWER